MKTREFQEIIAGIDPDLHPSIRVQGLNQKAFVEDIHPDKSGIKGMVVIAIDKELVNG